MTVSSAPGVMPIEDDAGKRIGSAAGETVARSQVAQDAEFALKADVYGSALVLCFLR